MSAEITTYPLNGIDYNAADVAAYESTRTSGVYSTDEDFAVASAGGMSVTVGAGRAWIHPSRFEGYSITKRESETLTLPLADSSRARIDRIVLRYDAASRKTTLLTLTGDPASTPTAPAITRTALVYDLCLAEILRPAGSTAVTAGDITDTRLDESLCGVMSDGVTGLPTAQLLAEARARISLLEETASDSAAAADKSQKAAAQNQADAEAARDAAAHSAAVAGTCEANAGQSAANAAASETEAAEYRDAAADSATNAAASETASGQHAAAAEASAEAAAKSAAEAKAAASTDTTLSMSGIPADAKTTGDALAAKADKKETETALAGKSSTGHTHDDRYYTEAEVDGKLAGKSNTNHTHDLSALINALSTGTAAPTDADYYVSQYAGGGTDTTTYHRRPMSALWAYIKSKADSLYQAKGNYAAASHTHKYAGSASAGGSANSAVKLDSSAGSATQPVYISGGKPVACSYTLGKSVPSNAVFTDTNTWRGVQNNLTSTATDQSLSAAMGKWLNENKAAANHTHSAGTSGAFSGVSASGSNYVRFSDGTQICWSYEKLTVNYDTGYKSRFIFPVPFKDANYAISGMRASSIDDEEDDYFCFTNKTSSYVQIDKSYNAYNDSTISTYICIGRWK